MYFRARYLHVINLYIYKYVPTLLAVVGVLVRTSLIIQLALGRVLVYIKWRLFARLSPRFDPPTSTRPHSARRFDQNRSNCAAEDGAVALIRLRRALVSSRRRSAVCFFGSLSRICFPHFRYDFRRYLSLDFPLIIADEVIE